MERGDVFWSILIPNFFPTPRKYFLRGRKKISGTFLRFGILVRFSIEHVRQSEQDFFKEFWIKLRVIMPFFLPVGNFMNFCAIQCLKNTKNIYGFWKAQKSTLCWILSGLGTPTTSRNWKMWNWRWPKVKYSYLPLKFHCGDIGNTVKTVYLVTKNIKISC